MKFKERYINSPLEELIHIIENEADYNPDFITAIKEIIVEKELSLDDISQVAKEVNMKRIEKQLLSFNIFNDKLELLSSVFLTKDDMQKLYEDAITEIKSRRADLEFDVWSYAIGGV